MFGTILISICTVMHIYVFWRAFSVPFVQRHIPIYIHIGAAVVLWTLLFLGRFVGHRGTGPFASALEFLGMNWIGILFLTFLPLLFIDLFTLFGFVLPRFSSILRGLALLTGILLSVFALFQGMRPPTIVKYEVTLPNLPKEVDGTLLIALSDTHLGSLIGERWLASRVAQINDQRPDMVLLLGDIFEGHGVPSDNMIAEFKKISAPLGVWAVTGNHEFHGNGELISFEKINTILLRNAWKEVKPGFVLAGVDDLTTFRRRGRIGDPASKALKDRPPGTTIFLSHTPWQIEKASKAGVDLMLSGHTHGGQIWPFDYLVQKRYPYLEGQFMVGDMRLIVCRGTGTWGPRMRLWHPSEILHITLRKANK